MSDLAAKGVKKSRRRRTGDDDGTASVEETDKTQQEKDKSNVEKSCEVKDENKPKSVTMDTLDDDTLKSKQTLAQKGGKDRKAKNGRSPDTEKSNMVSVEEDFDAPSPAVQPKTPSEKPSVQDVSAEKNVRPVIPKVPLQMKKPSTRRAHNKNKARRRSDADKGTVSLEIDDDPVPANKPTDQKTPPTTDGSDEETKKKKANALKKQNADRKKTKGNETDKTMVSVELEEDTLPPTKPWGEPKLVAASKSSSMEVFPVATPKKSIEHAQIKSSLPQIDEKKIDEYIKKTHFKSLSFIINLPESRELNVQFSLNFVVRIIPPSSPCFYSLVVGDQVIEVNSVVPRSKEELKGLLERGPAQVHLTVVRPWNVFPPTPARVAGLKLVESSSYFVTSLYPMSYTKNGFTLKFPFSRQWVTVTKIERNSRAAHVFIPNDRIHDISGSPANHFADMAAFRQHFLDVLGRDGVCTMLVERQLTLRSSPNPSVFAAKGAGPDYEMGDDAMEIGAREATRHALVKDKYRNTPCQSTGERDLVTKTACEDEEEKKRDKKRKKRKSKICFESKNEVFQMPSEVKVGTPLVKATAKSGMIGFLRSKMNF